MVENGAKGRQPVRRQDSVAVEMCNVWEARVVCCLEAGIDGAGVPGALEEQRLSVNVYVIVCLQQPFAFLRTQRLQFLNSQ